ncbi:MAG: MFS transporter [Candidatus Thorarchaeota archaeon]
MSADQESVSNARLSFALMLISNVIWVFGVYLYANFIGLFMREELMANSVQVGYWSTVFSLSMMLFVGLGGPLSAKLGEKRTLLLGWIGIIPAPIIYMFANSWQMALVGAFFEGISALAGAPVGAYITSVSRGSRRGQAFTVLSASSAIGGIPSPILGGIIVSLFGYQTLFFLAAVLFIISSILILPISSVRKSKSEATYKRTWNFFKNRVFILLTIFWFSINTLYWITNIFVPLYLYDRFGLVEAQIGVLGSISNACGAVLGPLMGWVGDNWSYSGALTLPVIGTLGFFGLLVASPSAFFLPIIYGFSGFIYGLNSLVNAIMSHNIPKGQLADALSAYYLIGRALTPISPVIGGLAFSLNAALPLIISSAFLPIPLILLIFVNRASKERRLENEKGAEKEVPVVLEDIHPPLS